MSSCVTYCRFNDIPQPVFVDSSFNFLRDNFIVKTVRLDIFSWILWLILNLKPCFGWIQMSIEAVFPLRIHVCVWIITGYICVSEPVTLTDLLVILINIMYHHPKPLHSDASHSGVAHALTHRHKHRRWPQFSSASVWNQEATRVFPLKLHYIFGPIRKLNCVFKDFIELLWVTL